MKEALSNFVGRLTSRKFLLAVAGVIVIIANANGHLSTTDINSVLAIVLGYMGVNVADAFVATR